MTSARPRTWVLALALLAFLASVLASPRSAPASAASEERGYIEMSDGVGLRYTVFLPDGEGPFPVLLQYSGYGAGTDPYDNGLAEFGARMRDQGFAVLGVNVRGTGCSEGEFDLFTPLWSTDGAAVVEWAATQPWSTGKVGMVGASFPGISQLMVASQQPPSLAAIAPAVPITDLYRDVGYPGGLYNHTFANFFTAVQKTGTAAVPAETAAGDSRCAGAVPSQNQPDRIIALQGPQHPYADDELFERFLPPRGRGRDRRADAVAVELAGRAARRACHLCAGGARRPAHLGRARQRQPRVGLLLGLLQRPDGALLPALPAR
ncbi:MAG: CocE/NonD family hydrolase [Actinomycetes bacterium]